MTGCILCTITFDTFSIYKPTLHNEDPHEKRGYLGILGALYRRDNTVLGEVDKHGRTLLI